MNKPIKLSLAAVLMAILLVCCKNEGAVMDDSPLGKMRTALSENPTQANASKLLKELTTSLANTTDAKEKKELLVEGLEVGKKHKLPAQSVAFIMPLIRDYEADPKRADYILELGKTMNAAQKTHASDIILTEFINKYPNHKAVDEAKKMVSPAIQSSEKYIMELGEAIFANPDQYGLNRKAAQNYVDACEAFAMVNPKNALSPDYLYKAAEIARSLRTFPKTLSIYDWIIEKYPDYAKTPTTLFLKGFVIENELEDQSNAKKVYEQFIETYPNHDLADDVKFLLENIGKSNEEILELIEKNKQAQ